MRLPKGASSGRRLAVMAPIRTPWVYGTCIVLLDLKLDRQFYLDNRHRFAKEASRARAMDASDARHSPLPPLRYADGRLRGGVGLFQPDRPSQDCRRRPAAVGSLRVRGGRHLLPDFLCV